MAHLASHTWTSLPKRAVVLVPVGSIEQHGPHLPLDTDTAIATAVADRAAELVEDRSVVVAPALSYGSSGEHQTFPGTASIGSSALQQVVIELVRSVRTWAERVVIVNAHGGNVTAVQGAVAQLKKEGHDVDWLPCATEDVDLHAGFTETSLMLHLRPADVRLDLAEAGNCAPLAEILPTMVEHGVRAVSPNGVLGDPAGASAQRGAELLDMMAQLVASRVPAQAES